MRAVDLLMQIADALNVTQLEFPPSAAVDGHWASTVFVVEGQRFAVAVHKVNEAPDES